MVRYIIKNIIELFYGGLFMFSELNDKNKILVDYVSNLFINSIEQGASQSDWISPYSENMITKLPINPEKEQLFTGINQLILMNSAKKNNFKDPRWLSKDEALASGGTLNDNEKGVTLKFFESFQNTSNLQIKSNEPFNIDTISSLWERSLSDSFILL